MRQPARDETHLADHCNYILPETSDRLHVLLARSSPPTATKSEAQHNCRLGIALHRHCQWCSVGFIYRLNDQQGRVGCRGIRIRARDVSNTDSIHVCPGLGLRVPAVLLGSHGHPDFGLPRLHGTVHRSVLPSAEIGFGFQHDRKCITIRFEVVNRVYS